MKSFHVMSKPVGSKCNLDCQYCFYLEKEALWGKGERFRMNDRVLEAYVKGYLESQQQEEVTFTWQGGEPTLMGLDFFRKAMVLQERFANGRKVRNSLQTNATLLNPEWVDFFKAHEFLVGVSIDGPRKLHDAYRVGKTGEGSWDAVMEGIEMLKSAGVQWNTLTCVHRGNQDRPQEVYRFLKGIGSKFLQFIPIVERRANLEARALNLKHAAPERLSGDHAEEVDTPVQSWSVDPEKYGRFMLEIFNRWIQKDVGKVFVQLHDNTFGKWVDPAFAGLCVFEETCGLAVALEHDGSLYSCDHYVYPEYKLGNICYDAMQELVFGTFQAQFGSGKREALPRQCQECAVLALCNGGCPKHRFMKDDYGGSGLNYLCQGYFDFFTKTAPYMRQMSELYRMGRAPSLIMKRYPKGIDF